MHATFDDHCTSTHLLLLLYCGFCFDHLDSWWVGTKRVGWLVCACACDAKLPILYVKKTNLNNWIAYLQCVWRSILCVSLPRKMLSVVICYMTQCACWRNRISRWDTSFKKKTQQQKQRQRKIKCSVCDPFQSFILKTIQFEADFYVFFYFYG